MFALVVVTPRNTDKSTMLNLTSYSHLAVLRVSSCSSCLRGEKYRGEKFGRSGQARFEAARIEHPHPAALAHAAGDLPGLIAETPEEIRSHCALNRAAGVLREYQAVQRPSGKRPCAGQKNRSTERHDRRIDRDAAAGSEGDAQCAN